MSDVTHYLSQVNDGDPSTADQLLTLVYEELRKMAAAKMAREKPGQTLQPTALVHEAYLRLMGEHRQEPWRGRRPFFAAAAEAMRRILVENARRKKSLKRGGGQRTNVEIELIEATRPPQEILARGRRTRIVRGRYDAAVTSDDNRRHWANADGLSANAANSAEVRRILRNRARYEVSNNSYARGIVLTLAHDVVGTGPRLQLLTADAESNRRIEQTFMQWAKAVGLPDKLRTMRMARATDGEPYRNLTRPVQSGAREH